MTYDNNNIFARVLRGELPSEVVAENEYAVAIKNIVKPESDIHDMVLPRGSYATFSDFIMNAKPNEFKAYLELVRETARMRNLLEAPSQVLINNGKDGGQHIPHLHTHIFSGRPLVRALPVNADKANGVLKIGDDNIPVLISELDEFISDGESSFGVGRKVWEWIPIMPQGDFKVMYSGSAAATSDHQFSANAGNNTQEYPQIRISPGKRIHLRADTTLTA